MFVSHLNNEHPEREIRAIPFGSNGKCLTVSIEEGERGATLTLAIIRPTGVRLHLSVPGCLLDDVLESVAAAREAIVARYGPGSTGLAKTRSRGTWAPAVAL